MMFVFQAEDGIRDLVRSRGLGDVYKRQSRQNDTLNDAAHISEIEKDHFTLVATDMNPPFDLSLIHI